MPCLASRDTRHPNQNNQKRIRLIGCFSRGNLREAGKLYSRIVAQNPREYSATLQLGRIALLSNRLDQAQKWFEKALVLKPNDPDAKVMLAEAFYRRDDFQKAAAALKGVDVSSNKLILEQYPTLERREIGKFQGPEAL